MEVHSLEDRTDRIPECQCPPCKKLKNINSKLKEAKELVAQLEAKQVAIKSEFNMAHDPVTGKLPVEVTARVFSVAMNDWSRLPTPLREGVSVVQAPLLFGTVSRRWREIAWSTPSLWTDLDIKSCREIDCVNSTTKAINMINQYSARWGDLILDIPDQCIPRLGGDAESGSRLTDITIYPFPEPPDRRLAKLHLPNATPRNVTCSYLAFRGLEINWAKATKVDFSLLFVDECLQLFRVAPQLMDCTIRTIVLGSDITYPIPLRPVVLNSLKRLSIAFGSDVTPSMLLSHIQTPFLEDVIYCGADLIGLKSLIIRSSCLLGSLSLSFFEDVSEIVDLLRNTVQLKDLDFIYCHLTNEFFDLLGATASIPPGELGGGFLPLLTQLRINRPSLEFSWNAFASMLAPTGPEPEGNHRRPLSKVSFYLERIHQSPPYINEFAVSRLLKAIQQGVHLSIRQGSDYLDLLEESRKFHENHHQGAEDV
ncbi:hypothetical protein NLJ89_g3993 [Agrocybe chaxingu]|uniref:F-box domain-containing protein n=1 Tax=Agrocybe chaxingu TaxID=84603 RepID=A0A9W8K4R8_9AGAR|nr:hypothetical protein NLJ89_g3993 [Agrocybe chaxingu]